jgi:FlaA1/EpsC-like NDP-sugar epimerase
VLPIVGDVTDRARVNEVLGRHRPDIIFHAAAHKHVPMMEHNPCEAVKNNVLGTRTVATAAGEHGVGRFLLISTDKAVNPTSVMGATKCVAEMVVHSLNRRVATRYTAVRFGNVLGSNGSVIPRFLAQIKAGGPVTVTHPDIRRFFMLIPEAVQLVLHATAIAEGGEIFVLEMGEQIRIDDMARHLVRLAGLVPDEDIAIEYTGLRPGEKLYEELLADGETIEGAGTERIRRVRREELPDPVILRRRLFDLLAAARAGDTNRALEMLSEIVPSFQPSRLPTCAPSEAAATGSPGMESARPDLVSVA